LTLPNPLLNSNADVLAEIANGVIPSGTEMRIQALVPLGNVFTGWTGNFGGSGLAAGDPDQIITNLEQHISITATYIASTNSPSPSPSPAPQIMNFMISDTPAPSYSGMFAAAPSPDQVPSKTVTMTFEGASLLGVSVEWSPSLAEQNWVKLPITATQELASLPDGRKLWELKASDPSASPQGFFRLRQTN
jgi:hypothetical protein